MAPVKSALLAATLLISAGGLAMAQLSSTYDPAQLPVIKGKVEQYTLTPRGEVNGFIMTDGTEVHVNPSLSTELVFAVHPGDAVTIHGLKARAIPMVAGVSVTNDASGTTVTGPMGRPGMWRGAALEDTGTIKAQLHEPRGEVNGVLLQDGTVVRMPPAEATRLATELTVGRSVVVHGMGLKSALGEVIMARQIGPDADHLTEIKAPFPHGGPGWMRGMHGMRGRGPGRDGMPPAPPPGPGDATPPAPLPAPQ
jgi:hypothetical protein